MPTVLVTAKREPAHAPNGLQKIINDIGTFFKNIPTMKFPGGVNPTLLQPMPVFPSETPDLTPYVNQIGSYSIPFVNSVLTDLTSGSAFIPDHTEEMCNSLPDPETAYMGALHGHYVSITLGYMELFLGTTAEGTGLIAAPETAGGSLVLTAAGAGVVAHSISTVTNAEVGLMKMSKKRTERPYDDLPQTKEEIDKMRKDVNRRTNGKPGKEDTELLEKLKTQEKVMGDRNKQKRKK